MKETNYIDKMLVMALERWDSSWMSRQSMAAALSRFTNVTYTGQPKYPVKIRDLFTLPRRRIQDGMEIQQLPSWMNTNFEDAHCHKKFSWQVKRKFIYRYSGQGPRALVVWHPSLLSYLDAFSVDVSCYYVVDFFEGLAVNKELRKNLKQQQDLLLEKVDVVFTTWRGLADRLGITDKAIIMPHGMDYDYYSRVSRNEFSLPDDMPRGKPVVGYSGSLKTKTDFDLLEKISDTLTNWNIVLIGHNVTREAGIYSRFADLLKRQNVFYLGLKTRAEMAGYLQAFDVCMMCYTVNEWTEFGLPLKMFEYFATGKPIVSTYLPSLEDYRDYVKVCENYDDFINAVANYKTWDTAESQQARMAFAAENTWEKRAKKMIEVLAEKAREKSSR